MIFRSSPPWLRGQFYMAPANGPLTLIVENLEKQMAIVKFIADSGQQLYANIRTRDDHAGKATASALVGALNPEVLTS